MVSFVVAGTQPPFPVILASGAFISFHFRSLGFISFHFSILGFMSFHFRLVGLHFLSFWPCGPSFPCIFGLVGFHFLAFWPCGPSFPCNLAFSGSASGAPPTSCEKWPVCPTSLQWIYQRRDRHHFAVFSLVGLHFLAFWPCGPSFPCILALWAFISLHFGLVGLHFLAIWPFRSQLPGSPPHVAQNGPFALRPYNGFISVVTGSILQFLRCGPSFPCILALWAFISLHF